MPKKNEKYPFYAVANWSGGGRSTDLWLILRGIYSVKSARKDFLAWHARKEEQLARLKEKSSDI